ncbi:MAG: amidohydrolase family protein, partial [Calditrichia bacterium]
MKNIDIPSALIKNARLYDPVDGPLPHTALLVLGSRIAAVGDVKDLKAYALPQTEMIDAQGGWLLPAFTDAHTHFLGYVKRRQDVRLEHCRSLGEVLDQIRQKAAQTPPGKWITGGGWNYNIWQPGEFPTRRQLDEISTRHFIALDSKDWH